MAGEATLAMSSLMPRYIAAQGATGSIMTSAQFFAFIAGDPSRLTADEQAIKNTATSLPMYGRQLDRADAVLNAAKARLGPNHPAVVDAQNRFDEMVSKYNEFNGYIRSAASMLVDRFGMPDARQTGMTGFRAMNGYGNTAAIVAGVVLIAVAVVVGVFIAPALAAAGVAALAVALVVAASALTLALGAVTVAVGAIGGTDIGQAGTQVVKASPVLTLVGILGLVAAGIYAFGGGFKRS